MTFSHVRVSAHSGVCSTLPGLVSVEEMGRGATMLVMVPHRVVVGLNGLNEVMGGEG